MYCGIQKLLTRLCYLLIIALVFSYLRKDRLPDYKSIDHRLLQAPVQQSITGAQFTLDFKDRSYQVRPRALYELKGLVVFVKELNILRSTNRIWRDTFKFVLIALLALQCLKFAFFWFFAPSE